MTIKILGRHSLVASSVLWTFWGAAATDFRWKEERKEAPTHPL